MILRLRCLMFVRLGMFVRLNRGVGIDEGSGGLMYFTKGRPRSVHG
jgi:hypothetical protein